MPALKKRPQKARGGIYILPVDEITPSPVQPRKHFDRDSLSELAASISQHGVLQPLTVRARKGKYELVAGERRLRAAKLAGLREVPCIMVSVNMEESNLIALVENLQRSDLDFLEEAEGISQLIRMFGMSQEEAARRIGKSQSAVANKLRLLRLPSDVLERMRESCLTERHGRTLLRLPTSEAQRTALDYIIENRLNVAAAEGYIEYLLTEPEPEPETACESGPEPEIERESEIEPESEPESGTELKKKGGKTTFVLKDVRVFLNSLTRGLNVMKEGGIDVGMEREETDEDLILKIRIPKTKQPLRK